MIIDASVAFKWIADEEGSDRALELFGQRLVAPLLMLSEVGNALRKMAVRAEIAGDVDFDRELARLVSLVDLIDERQAVPRALAMSRLLAHPIYDCVYLALAEIEGTPLITADIKFAEKVARTEWASLVQIL
jgi:predicted nucleic acid-binding protein